MLVKFYLATVFGEIANTDYEGEIKKYGDKVIIRVTPDITINDYTVGQNLVYQRPESESAELLIDKGKYFAFTCDDVISKQSDVKLMDNWSGDAGEQMKIAVDTDVLEGIVGDADSSNKGNSAGADSGDIALGASTAPLQVTKTNVIDVIVDCGLVLDEQNRPDSDRALVIPSWMAAMLKKSDLKDASMTGDGKSILRNGRLGMIDRFTLYQSNNLKTATDTVKVWYAPFCHKSAISFAAQMTKVETLRAESTFGDLVRGLNIYGYEVLQPKSLGELYICKG